MSAKTFATLLRRLAGPAGFAVVVVVAQTAAAADAPVRRVALVVGNGAYAVQPKTAGAIEDARAVAATARRLGFEVIEATDLDRKRTEETLARFYRAASGADVAFVYYAGHAIGLGGRNYLLPTDATLDSPYDFDFEAVSVDGILAYLRAHARHRVVVLDAARAHNGTGRDFVVGEGARMTASEPGLAAPAGESGTLVLTPTAPGRLATLRPDGRSPFTAAFLQDFAGADRAPADLVDRLAATTRERTGGADTPAAAGSLPTEFRFAAKRDLDGFAPVQKIMVRMGEPVTPMDMAIPAAPHDPELGVVFERMPTVGDVVRMGRSAAEPVWPGDVLRQDETAVLGYRQEPAPKRMKVETSFRIEGPLTRPARGRLEIELTDDPAAIEAARRERAESARVAAAAVDDFGRRNGRIAVEVPVGVGPRPIPIDLATTGSSGGPSPTPTARAGDEPARVAIDRTPSAGRLSVAGVQVAAMGAIPLSTVKGLAYEAPVGAEGSSTTVTIAAAGGGRAAKSEVTIVATLTACDRLAGDRLDRQGVAGGLYPNEIEGPKAVAACEKDIATYGENGRFRLQLGRALMAARDPKAARTAFERAAALGHARAHYHLGLIEGVGADGSVDNPAANRHFERGAEAGDVYALYSFGKSLFYGRGVRQDRKRGLEMMMQAAEGGHSYAMNELGAIFLAGDGVTRDAERARRWFEAGVRLGDAFSMHNLGLLHLDGKGVRKDFAKARDLFRRAAETGHAGATNELGRMAQHGWGEKVDMAEAARWYRRAAELGEPYGAYSYAWMLGSGAVGGKTDLAGAARYLALSVAVQLQPRHDIARDARATLAKIGQPEKLAALSAALTRLDPKAKARPGGSRAELDRTIARLRAEGQAIDRGADLDAILIAAERAAWLKRRPRLDTL